MLDAQQLPKGACITGPALEAPTTTIVEQYDAGQSIRATARLGPGPTASFTASWPTPR